MIPYGRQDITQEDIDAVVAVLSSDYLTQGPLTSVFEETLAAYVGAKYGISVNSATSALHVACLALGLGPGDWLWTSPISFVASANCGLYCGAKIDFVDIDPLTYNLCPNALETKLALAELEGRLPKVLVAVHLCGQPCDMQTINALGQKYGFRIIEDASHAIGARYKGDLIGDCRYSDITVFSFHPVKIITTAEGGAALTNSEELRSKMALFRNHGITRNPREMVGELEGPWYYQQLQLGFNYRMTELQAALGLSQLERLSSYVSLRHELASNYDILLKNFPLITPWQDPSSYSSFHLYVIRLQLNKLCKSRLNIFEAMRERGIGVNVHYIPIYKQPYYQFMGFNAANYPNAEAYYAEAMSLPIFPKLVKSQQIEVVSALCEIIG
jgi:UDP-4-amino-4,6-dideoxy-N-acetyl-beta-L-altrosamine transaminase